MVLRFCSSNTEERIYTMTDNIMNFEAEKTKAYELRNLTADDIFPMFQIVSKIGIKEFKTCFDAPEIKEVIAKVTAGEEADLNTVGMFVALDIAGIIIGNLPKCKDDIYLLLSQLSGKDKKEIAALPLATFLQMVTDVVRKEEFKDFFQVVAKLFK